MTLWTMTSHYDTVDDNFMNFVVRSTARRGYQKLTNTTWEVAGSSERSEREEDLLPRTDDAVAGGEGVVEEVVVHGALLQGTHWDTPGGGVAVVAMGPVELESVPQRLVVGYSLKVGEPIVVDLGSLEVVGMKCTLLAGPPLEEGKVPLVFANTHTSS